MIPFPRNARIVYTARHVQRRHLIDNLGYPIVAISEKLVNGLLISVKKKKKLKRN